MINVRLVMDRLDPPGLVALRARGHAAADQGHISLVCGAFTALLRSFAGAVENAGIPAEIRAEGPGAFDFELRSDQELNRDWFNGAAQVLLQGITDLEREYPEEIRIRVDRR